MTRFTASFLLLSVLALSKASLLVQAEEVSSSTCVIHTPQEEKIWVGHPLKITWENCKGLDKVIEVRFGNPTSLDKKDDYACKVEDMKNETECYWTPSEEGHFSLSVKDDATSETFTAEFEVEGEGHGKAKRALGATQSLKGEKGKDGKGKGKGKGKGGKGAEKNAKKDHPKVEKKPEYQGHPAAMGKGAEENAKKGNPKVEKKPEYQGYPVAVPRRRSLPRRI